MNYYVSITLCAFLLLACKKDNAHTVQGNSEVEKPKFQTTGSIEIFSEKIRPRLDEKAQIEIIADGFQWTEGPLWVASENFLLFSEIPSNSIYRWSEEKGAELYLSPSGYTGDKPRKGEPGSNGLLINQHGQLVLCQHGDRRLAIMEASLSDPKPAFRTIIDNYEGMRFNSPNDAVFDVSGHIYFTDPPYGLEGNSADPAKETPFQGVYQLKNDGILSLLTDAIHRPNGIGLSPNGEDLYIANSEGSAMWYKMTRNDEGDFSDLVTFYDDRPEQPLKGAPDGLVVDREGFIWATGPGGVWVFDSGANVLARIYTGEATSNCAFNEDESVLYMTCDDYVMRLSLRS